MPQVEPVEVSEQVLAIGVDAGQADHRPGESTRRLVGHERRVEDRPDGAQRPGFPAPGEPQHPVLQVRL